MGIPVFSLEHVIGQTNLPQQHFGMGTVLGVAMESSMELMCLEIGMPESPFQYNYYMYKDLVSNTWCT